VLTFDENLSPNVQQALPRAVETVFAALEREREPI
jgi:hypothetical protein